MPDQNIVEASLDWRQIRKNANIGQRLVDRIGSYPEFGCVAFLEVMFHLIDDIDVAVEVHGPNLRRYHRTGQDLALVTHEQFKQGTLLRRQLIRLA